MEQLFLVATLKEPLKAKAEKIRKKINEHFSIYEEPFPDLHMTVEVLRVESSEDLSLAEAIIAEVLEDVGPFKIEVDGFGFFASPFKAVTLEVKKNKFIEEISHKTYNKLCQYSLTDRDNAYDWKFHITLAGTFASKREWSEKEAEEAYRLIEDMDFKGECLIDSLELWRPFLEEKKKKVQVFSLKS